MKRVASPGSMHDTGCLKLHILSPLRVGAEVMRAGEEGPGAEVHSAPHLDPGCVSKTGCPRLERRFRTVQCYMWGFPRGSGGKESSWQCRRPGFHPWVGNIPWRKKGQPTPIFLPGKSMDRGAWWAAVHGVAKRWT